MDKKTIENGMPERTIKIEKVEVRKPISEEELRRKNAEWRKKLGR